jgi:DNA-binding PadR family transcriptional regulator
MPGGPWPDDGEAPYREEQDTDDGAGASAERADMIHYSHMVGEHPDLNSTAASLLGFLESYGPMSGYDIVGMVEGSIGYFWNVTRSQVYRELNRLAEAELVEMGESGARARRPYTITGAGRRAFLNWLALPPGPDIIRLPFLLRYFFGQHLDPQTLRAFVDLHRPQHEQRLHYFQSLIPKLLDEQPFMAHVAELGVAYEETMLAWFDTIPQEQARQQATRDLKAVRPVKEASPPDSASA